MTKDQQNRILYQWQILKEKSKLVYCLSHFTCGPYEYVRYSERSDGNFDCVLPEVLPPNCLHPMDLFTLSHSMQVYV